MWGDSDENYEVPEWIANLRSNPISQSKNTRIIAKIKVRIEQPGLNFDLVGDGSDDYVDFEQTGLLSTGEDQEIMVTANANLPDEVCVLNKAIAWKISGRGLRYETLSNHTIYVTYGTPYGNPTDQRVLWFSKECRGKTTPDEIVLTASNYINTNEPPVFNPETSEWPIGTPPIWLILDPSFTSGAACIAYANLLKHISNILGISGGSLVKVYASKDSNFDFPDNEQINGYECMVVVIVENGDNADANYFEGCLEINNRYYLGAGGYNDKSASSKQEVHTKYASWPNRLVYFTTTAQGQYLFFDKNFVEYKDPTEIDQNNCIPIP